MRTTRWPSPPARPPRAPRRCGAPPAADRQRIAADGKIPKHEAWAARIAKGELAIDTMLNLAGLASFVADQAALDARIRKNMAG
jgi:hypothetical protein